MAQEIKQTKIISNVIWKLSASLLSQMVSFIVSIVLARLLMPEDYGAVAMMTVFITIANVFVASGIPTALIQKKDADEKDFSSVFFFNLVLSIILYLILFFVSPYIAEFYKTPILACTLRVMGISIIVAALNSVQSAYVSKQMLFKRYFWSALVGTALSGAVGIGMAYAGFGVWALVFQKLTNVTVEALVLLFTVKWRPILYYSWQRMKSLVQFGWKILFEGLCETMTNELSSIMIGRVYTSADLGCYSKGTQFPNLIVSNFCSSVSAVLLPAISSEQDDRARVKTLLRKAVRTSTYVTFPMLVGLALVAEPFIRLVLTEKWLGTVPYMQLFCLIYGVSCFLIPRHQVLNGIGRSDVYMYEHMIGRIFRILILFMVYKRSVMAIALCGIVSSSFMVITVMFTSKKYNSYSYREQIADVFPVLFACLIMAVPVYFAGMLPLADLPLLVAQVAIGGATYVAASVVLRLEGFSVVYGFAKSALGKVIKPKAE